MMANWFDAAVPTKILAVLTLILVYCSDRKLICRYSTICKYGLSQYPHQVSVVVHERRLLINVLAPGTIVCRYRYILVDMYQFLATSHD